MIATSEKKIYPVYEAGDDIPIGEKFVMDYDRSSVIEVYPANPLSVGLDNYCTKCHFRNKCNVDIENHIPLCDDFAREDKQFVWFKLVKTLQK